MPMPSSGKITTQTFRDFFEISASTPINSSDWYRGGPYVRANYQSQNQGTKSINNQVPTSGRIALSDLYGVYKVVDANNYVPGNTNPNNTSDNVPGFLNDSDQVPYVPSNNADLNPGNNNAPNNDYGAGPAGAYQDPFGSTNPGNWNQNNTDPTNVSDGPGGPPTFGDSSDTSGTNDSDPNPANYTPGNPYTNNPDGGTAGNTNPGNPVDGSAGPPGEGDPNPAVPASYPDGQAGPPAFGDPSMNLPTSNDPNTNPPYWADHERLV